MVGPLKKRPFFAASLSDLLIQIEGGVKVGGKVSTHNGLIGYFNITELIVLLQEPLISEIGKSLPPIRSMKLKKFPLNPNPRVN